MELERAPFCSNGGSLGSRRSTRRHAQFSGRAKAPAVRDAELPRGQRPFVCIAKGDIFLFGLRFGVLGRGELRRKRLIKRLIDASH